MNVTRDELNALLRLDLMSFVERAFLELESGTTFEPAPFLELLAAKLIDVADGKCRRLIINLPPRHLKSHMISVAFVAWLLGRSPERNIICASYGQDLADKLGRDCRALMRSAWYKEAFGEILNPGRQAVNDFETIMNGGRLATSVGGPLTGRGADLIIIDDPLKPTDALSETSRKSVKSWYDNTLLSRLNSKTKGAIIITMQRLHQDDLVGHVLESDGWEVIALPAIAEQEECYRFSTVWGERTFSRSLGEVLHPQRESAMTLQSLRQTMSEYNFVSQYQQNPMPQDGAIIKRHMLRYCSPEDWPQKFERIVQSWDTAIKTSDHNDFSVCTTWGVFNKSYYLIHVLRQRLEYPDLKKAVRSQKERFQAREILIEDKASGSQLIQDLKREHLSGVVGCMPGPQIDKQTRLMLQLEVFSEHRVVLPTYAPWLEEYVKELLSFPGSRFDDQVDSTSQAFERLKEPDPLEIWRKLGAGGRC